MILVMYFKVTYPQKAQNDIYEAVETKWSKVYRCI